MPGNAILQQIDVPIERLLADFRWQSIDFVDALTNCQEKICLLPNYALIHFSMDELLEKEYNSLGIN